MWSDLGRILGYHGIPGLSTQLKNSYTRVILPFEEYEARNASKSKSPSKPSSVPPKKVADGDGKRSRSSTSALAMEGSPPGSPLTSTSSPLSEPPEDRDQKANGNQVKPRRSTRMGSSDQSPFSPKTCPSVDADVCRRNSWSKFVSSASSGLS
jgi:histone demethylase JARID1